MTTPLELELRKAEEDAKPDRAPFQVPPGRVTRTMSIVPEPVTIFRYVGPGDLADDADEIVARAKGSSGAPLPDDVRTRFERSLDADLASVRVHTGGASAAAARAVGAHAYAHGKDIHFADGQYRPDDPFGLHLLAHEVAHTVQQAGTAPQRQHKLAISTPGDAAEVEADRAAEAMIAGTHAAVSAAPSIVARNPDAGAPPPAASGAPAAGGAADPDKPALADSLEVTAFDFQKPSGPPTAVPSAQDVQVDSPKIKLTASVGIKNSVPKDKMDKIGTVKVGPIQNVTSASRVGVYKKADGTVVAEFNQAAGTAADAQTRPGDPSKRAFSSEPPFYQRPATLTSQASQVDTQMDDQPGFTLPATMSGGTLTETKGADNFITAVAALRDGEPVVQLKQESWTVPWTMQVDAAKTGQGAPVTGKETQDKAPVTDPNAPIVAATAKQWFSFKTVEDAKAAPAATLLSSLPVAKTQDPDSYKNICDAITQLNWAFKVTIRCASKFSVVMSDNMKISAKGVGSMDKSFDFAKGATTDVSFNFGTIFTVDQLTDSSQITITLNGESQSLTAPWAAPFASAGEVEFPGSAGHYFITKTGIK